MAKMKTVIILAFIPVIWCQIFSLTSIKSTSPQEDVEGGSITAPCAGGVHTWDNKLTLDHVVLHWASDFCHSLKRQGDSKLKSVCVKPLVLVHINKWFSFFLWDKLNTFVYPSVCHWSWDLTVSVGVSISSVLFLIIVRKKNEPLFELFWAQTNSMVPPWRKKQVKNLISSSKLFKFPALLVLGVHPWWQMFLVP